MAVQNHDSVMAVVHALLEEERSKIEAGCDEFKIKVSFLPTSVVNRQRAKSLRPGPDFVGRAVAFRRSKAAADDSSKTSRGTPLDSQNQTVALKVLRGVCRQLSKEYFGDDNNNNNDGGGVALALVNASGHLLVVSGTHCAAQRAVGMGLCRGCGSFFSHPRASGLASHQQSTSSTRNAWSSACLEAGLQRVAEEEKNDEEGGKVNAALCADADNSRARVTPEHGTLLTRRNDPTPWREKQKEKRLAMATAIQATKKEQQQQQQQQQQQHPHPVRCGGKEEAGNEGGDGGGGGGGGGRRERREGEEETPVATSSASSSLSSSSALSAPPLPLWLTACRDGDLGLLKSLTSQTHHHHHHQHHHAASAAAAPVFPVLGGEGSGWDPLRAKDKHGSGPLSWAAGSGHLHVCKWLVGDDEDDDEDGDGGEVEDEGEGGALGGDGSALRGGTKGTSTRASARASARERMRQKLVVPPTHCGTRKDGRQALHWAARNGHLPVLQWLVDGQKVCVNTPTADGDTAVMFASWQGHLKVLRWLCEEKKADVHAVNRWGCNAAFKAARMDGSHSSLAVLRYVASPRRPEQGKDERDNSGVDGSQHTQQREGGEGEGLELEFAGDGGGGGGGGGGLGVDCNLVNGNGHSLLHKAAIYGRRDVCEWLLEHSECRHRAQVALDKRGQSPSDCARFNGHFELAAYLRHAEDRLWHALVLWKPPPPPPPLLPPPTDSFELELELELLQTHLTQKPMLW